MKQKNIKLILGFLVLLFHQLVAGENFDHDFEAIKQQYGKHNAVYLYKHEDLIIDFEKDSLLIKKHVKKAILLLNENSKLGSLNYIHFSSFKTVDNIKAFTYLPKNGRYKKIKATNFKTTSSSSKSVFYDDSKQIEITFPQVSIGAIMTLEYDEVIKDPYFLEGSYFQYLIPVLKTSLSVKVHEDICLHHRFFNKPANNIHESIYKKGEYNYYEWQLSDVDEGKYGVSYINETHLSPHIKLFLGNVSYPMRNKQYYGETPDGLFNLYSSFINDIDTVRSAEFVEMLDSIVKDCLNEEEKAKQILYWVQKNIKYVAYEQGFRGFIPHSAETVFRKRFGDCKDMASLIVGLMRTAGIPCYYAWVGTRHIAYTYEELPTISTDNHMIAAYKNGDDFILMDGTMDLYEFGMIPHHIQGKQVLIALSENDYKIVEVPVTDVSKSSIVDSVFLRIDDNAIKGSAHKLFNGYNRYEIAYALNGRHNSHLEKKLNATLNKGSNKFRLDTFRISDIWDRDKSFLIDYEFTLNDYVQNLGSEIYVNLNLDKPLAKSKIDTTYQSIPVENDFKFQDVCVTSLKIPEGFHASYIPKDCHFSGPDMSYRISYRKTGTEIIQRKQLNYNFLLVKPENFKAWDAMIAGLNKAYRETIVLEKLITETKENKISIEQL